MAIVVELPRLSDTMEEGVIAKWHVGEGDKVKRGQVIAEIETDKATMEVPASSGGKVVEIKVAEGDKVSEGAVLLIVEGEGAAAAPAVEAAPRGRPKRCARGSPRPGGPCPGHRRRVRGKSTPRHPCAHSPGSWTSTWPR